MSEAEKAELEALLVKYRDKTMVWRERARMMVLLRMRMVDEVTKKVN